jgi:hypothetical protein
MLTKIGNNYIICSGVSAGTIDAVLPYLAKMAAVTMGDKSHEGIPTNMFPTCERNGVDQGVHNVLVHTNTIKGLKVWGQQEGPVANMQAQVGQVRKTMEVFNYRGDKYAVVHQYDRHIGLQKYLFKKYVYWTDTADPMNEWRDTPECKEFEIKKDVDAFRGTCDLARKGGATGPATCCKQCKANPRCEAFTYTEQGMCFLKSCVQPQFGPRNHMQGAVSAWLR